MLINTHLLQKWFEGSTGIPDKIDILTICYGPGYTVKKGLYIPLVDTSEDEIEDELKQAIANGAVATLWEKEREVPIFTPNHFPIFYCERVDIGMLTILKKYSDLIADERESKASMTKIVQIDQIIHNIENASYDNAVRDEILTLMSKLPRNVVERGRV